MTSFNYSSLSEYGRNALRFGSGTALSGLIPVVGALFLMKLYTPGEYGALAVFISSYFILSVISTGRYESAIILPGDEEKARYLTLLPILLSFCVCLFFTLLLIPFGDEFSAFFQLSNLGGTVFFIPITAFIFASIQSFFYFANRSKSYGLMAGAKITNNAVQVGSQVGFGLLLVPFNGLIAGRILGRVAGLAMYAKVIRGFIRWSYAFQWTAFVAVAKEYIHFPKHLSLSFGLSAFYQQIPTLFITAIFEPAVAGQLAIATQLVAVPNALVATAIGDVFRQKAAEEFRTVGSFRKTLLTTMRTLFLLAIVPFILVIVLAPAAFEWYDPLWADAGSFASILGVAFFFSFVVTPIDKSLLVVEKTGWLLYWNLAFFAGHLLITLPVFLLDLDIFYYLWLLVGLRVVATLTIAWLSYRVSQQ